MSTIVKNPGLPRFLWRNLLCTAAYIISRVVRSALEKETPFKPFYSEELNLSRLWGIGAVLCTSKHTQKQLEDKAWEGELHGHIPDNKMCGICDPAKRSVIESRKVIFIETSWSVMPLPEAGVDFMGGARGCIPFFDITIKMSTVTANIDAIYITNNSELQPLTKRCSELTRCGLIKNIRGAGASPTRGAGAPSGRGAGTVSGVSEASAAGDA